MADIADITAIVAPEVAALGFDLVRVRWQGGDDVTLQVMAERAETGQLTIDDCTALSHRLSDRFDALEAEGRDPIDQAYRLEVSSPGIDRPLTRLKDFSAWAGHDARLVLSDGVVPPETAGLGEGARKNLSGILAGVEGGAVLIDDRKAGRMAAPFADIAEAKLILTDRLIAATRPLDAAGADETIEYHDDTADISDDPSEAED